MAYKIIYQKNKEIKTKIVENIDQKSLPKSLIEIKEIKNTSILEIKIFEKITSKEYKRIFYELSLMLNSKILFHDALDILIKKEKKVLVKQFLQTLQTSFLNSYNISNNLKSFNVPILIKSFLVITQNSGNISKNIEALNKILTQENEIKKDFIKVLIYPMILLIAFFCSLLGIFEFVLPRVSFMLEQKFLHINLATKILFESKYIIDNYGLLIVLTLTIISFLLIYFYKKLNKIRYKFDKILFKRIPIISKLYKNKVLYIFFLMIELLLESKYEFHESLLKAKVLINNKYLLDKISNLDSLLKNGKNISFAFEKIDVFDELTLSLIKTGEISNSMETTINEIKNINKKRFDEKLKLFSILIEPAFFIIITGLIVWIIIAIFVPLWSMTDMLKM